MYMVTNRFHLVFSQLFYCERHLQFIILYTMINTLNPAQLLLGKYKGLSAHLLSSEATSSEQFCITPSIVMYKNQYLYGYWNASCSYVTP